MNNTQCDLYIHALNNISFPDNFEEKILIRLQNEQYLHKRKLIVGSIAVAWVFMLLISINIFTSTNLQSSYLSDSELQKLSNISSIKEYTLPAGSNISNQHISSGEMLILNVPAISSSNLRLQGNIDGENLLYDVGIIINGFYTEVSFENTSTTLDYNVDTKAKTEYCWCITNRSDNTIYLSGLVSTSKSNLLYKDYGDNVITVTSKCNIIIHDIHTLTKEEALKGIYLYNCNTQENEKQSWKSSTLEIQIDKPGSYIIYALTESEEMLNLIDYITIEHIDDEVQGIIGL